MTRADVFDRYANLGEATEDTVIDLRGCAYDEAPALDAAQPAGARQTTNQKEMGKMPQNTPRTPGEIAADEFVRLRHRGAALGLTVTAEYTPGQPLVYIVNTPVGEQRITGENTALKAFLDGYDGTAPQRILLGETPVVDVDDDHLHHVVVVDTSTEADQVADALDDEGQDDVLNPFVRTVAAARQLNRIATARSADHAPIPFRPVDGLPLAAGAVA